MNRFTKSIAVLFIILLITGTVRSQEIYTTPADPGIVRLLDELAMDHVISINKVSLPWSRAFMARMLTDASLRDTLLTPMQRKEIQFYLRDFKLEIMHLGLPGIQDNMTRGIRFGYDPIDLSLTGKKISFSLRPLLDFRQIVNVNDAVTQVKPGIAIYGYIGKHVGILAGITKEFDTQILSNRIFFTPDQGGNWNTWSAGGGSYAEWFGQVTVSWKWGMIGFFKDRFQWGENYNGANIFSEKPPSFPRVRLYLHPAKWIEFEYYHGFLKPDVRDSLTPGVETGGADIENIKKYIAANLVTFKPWKDLDISVGNSIVYDGRIQLAYLIPVLFYKSVDHTLTMGIENQNAQLFFSISSRQIKHLNLFITLFVDEFMMSRVRTPDEHNFLGWKAGVKLCDWPARNLSFTLEGTRTLPGTYQHFLPTTTFASDGYSMGHWLRENSQDIFTSLEYRLLRGLSVSLSYTFAEHGGDYEYSRTEVPTTAPVLEDITWRKSQFDASVNYSLVSNLWMYITYEYRSTRGDVKYTPPLFMGKTHSLIAGFRLGF